MAVPPDLECGGPLGPPVPTQQPLLGGEVAPLSPRSVGAQSATGDQWRNNSRKNEGRNQSKNNTQLWMRLVIEARSDAVKSNIAEEPGMLCL